MRMGTGAVLVLFLSAAPAASFSGARAPLGGTRPHRAVSRATLPRSVAASLPFGGGGAAAVTPRADALKVLYDGKCMVCLTNKRLITFFDRRRGLVNFVNIREKDYSPAANANIQFEDAMKHFHAIAADGTIATKADAVFVAYAQVGLGWAMAVLRFPVIRWFIDIVYAVVSKHRYTISKFLPGGKALTDAVSSLNDVSSAAMGEGCDDEEECMLDYDDDDDDDA